MMQRLPSESAFWHRDASFEVHAIVVWPSDGGANSERLEQAQKYVRTFASLVRNFGMGGGYLNIENQLEQGSLPILPRGSAPEPTASISRVHAAFGEVSLAVLFGFFDLLPLDNYSWFWFLLIRTILDSRW